MGTDSCLDDATTSDMELLYLQIAWALVYTNSMRDFTFLGHPNSSATSAPGALSLYDADPSGLRQSWAAYSWKDENSPFDPHDYTQYPTTYSCKYPHLPYIKRQPDPHLCLARNDPRIISNSGFHIDVSYIHDLVEFSQKAFDSFVSWKLLGAQWNVEPVLGVEEDVSSLQAALHYEYDDISHARQAIHNILRYSYEVAACRTLYFYRTLHMVLGKCQFTYGVDDSMVGTVLEHPFPATSWAQELVANGVPIFCIKSDVWRHFICATSGYQQGSHEIEEQNILKSSQDAARVRTIRVRAPAQTRHPSNWTVVPARDPPEPPIEDTIFQIISNAPGEHIDLLRNLKQVFGDRLTNIMPDVEPLKVCFVLHVIVDCIILTHQSCL
jgi:hypothetical protein